jgi:UDP-GlcNAc:undecaprenyl-phosphate GlcNAc-1-phosphate transferase
MIPIILYAVEEGRASWMGDKAQFLYRLCYGIIAVFLILTVELSRRSHGFKMSTMDFLIIFIAVAVPNLTGAVVQHVNLGLLAAEIIVLFFGYEVLINELREKFGFLAATTLTATVILGVRGYTGL